MSKHLRQQQQAKAAPSKPFPNKMGQSVYIKPSEDCLAARSIRGDMDTSQHKHNDAVNP